MPKETASKIDTQAADWAARIDRAPLTETEQAVLDAWLAEDMRHLGAFGRARAIALHSERAAALAPGYRAPEKAPARRHILMGGAGMAASLAVATIGGLAYATRGEAYATHIGELKVVPLSDGSVVSLNTQSRIRVHYSHDLREIHLEDGEALFDVARDARPFVVRAGETRVLADATAFTVRHLDSQPVQVTVKRGAVSLQAGNSTPVRLTTNMRAVETAPERIAVAAITPAEIDRGLAWREQRLAFEGETLADAAGEFRRYSDTRIVIDDPMIAREQITGLFQANDPVGFSQAVAASFGLRAEVGDGEVVLHR
ncbi:FecR family protein [Asticcacaulis solisilvae]|uniref:FecR family protein n=1 Tax=Asticcacaulis solisilvae TaxID=1217274 RepID=UPI003FD85595